MIDLTAAPPRLRGFLSRWGVEVRAGLYVGSSGSRVRDAIWELCTREVGPGGSAVLVYDARNPQGFEARTWGANRRELADIDGLWLCKFRPRDDTEPVPFETEDLLLPVDDAYMEEP